MYQTTASMPSSVNSTGVVVARTNTPDFHTNFFMYLASLESWAATEANGIKAENNIKKWLNNGNVNAVLDISELSLKSLPPLPDNLKNLKARKNELVGISENHLPATLEAIDLHGNQLTSLPESLPISQLKLLNASDNKLTRLPWIAHNLNRECKVYLGKNNLGSVILTSMFGPEQNSNGMRQASSAAEFAIRQADAVKRLTSAISAWMPVIDLSLELFAKDISGMDSFASFLYLMQTAPFIKNASLCTAMVNIIKKTACNSKLCHDVFQRTAKLPNRSTHQLTLLFFAIKRITIHADIENGLYDDRPANLVAFIKHEFRATAIQQWMHNRLKPEIRELFEKQDDFWADIATCLSSFINLDLEIEISSKDKSNSHCDLIELTQIIPNHIKDWADKNFANFFSNRSSNFAGLLQTADPIIKDMMANDLDSDGNTLHGERLNEFHAKQINDYFARIGQPELHAQVWPTIDNPNHFSISPDQLNINFSNKVDLSQLSPEQREQVEKCLIQ